MAFSKECWEIIKEDLAAVFRDFHSNGRITKGTNATFIHLIPKKSRAVNILDYRSISLVTSPYKIIAKVLFNRIREVRYESIDRIQFAFIKK